MPTPMMNNRALKEYEWRLKELFVYDVFEEDDFYILRISFDYIKQHTIISFPTMLFFAGLDKEIELKYRIISKHSAKVVNGIICVKP